MDELRLVAEEAIERCQRKRVRDRSAIKSAIKNDLSGYLYKTTKRNPMILPLIMEIKSQPKPPLKKGGFCAICRETKTTT